MTDYPASKTFFWPGMAVPGFYAPQDGFPSSSQVVAGVFDLAAASATTRSQQKAFKKIGAFMERFGQGLDNTLGTRPRRLRDAEYIRVSELCKQYGRKDYGMRPRTLAVLRWIGCPEAIDGFVDDRLSDIALPYTERNLPRCVKGQQMRSKFLELQHYVLTNQAADLERPDGPHLNIEKSARTFFDVIKPLGSGGFGTVDHVVSRLSLQQYALKSIPRGQSFKRDRVAIRSFENELMSLKHLSHKHLVKLIGSYTDQDHVGLLMTPIADMNLADYLSAPEQDCPDRKNCLRQFFGCLAAGVEYLHSQKIRHKDIKPENVLVLRNSRRVLLTDFGTAHNWSDDDRGTSSGSIHEAFTERYCAPEVYGRKRRNESSDIWSLGCIFLEMSTVLSDLTVRQMREFFQSNGNGRHFIRENQPAYEAWYELIVKQATIPSDVQVIELGKRLCHQIPLERPTAAEIASEIVDLRGPIKFHCGCCELKSDHWTKVDMVKDLQSITKTEEWTMNQTIMPEMELDQSEGPSPMDESSHNYQSPWAQEIQEDMTVLYFDAEARPVCQSKPDNKAQGSPLEKRAERILTPITEEPVEIEETTTKTLTVEKATSLECEWPGCTAAFVSNAADGVRAESLLQTHCRCVHGCHELGRKMLMIDQDCGVINDDSADSNLEPAQLLNYVVDPESSEPDPIVQTIRKIQAERRERKSNAVGALVVSEAGEIATTSDSHDAPRDNQAQNISPTRPAGAGVRFTTLPEDRRPEATTIPAAVNSSEPDWDLNEILEEPLIEAWWPFLSKLQDSGVRDSHDARRPPIPQASYVPSFHLAATNRFTKRETDIITNSGAGPLFVYGTLMFPSILRVCAEHYTTEEGIYSSAHQRRLRTVSSDWAFVNESLQNAAEKMTPAVVHGAFRGKVRGRPWAFTEKEKASMRVRRDVGEFGSGPSEVHGFVIFGLSEEAYRCLDHWHNEEMPSRLGLAPKPSQSKTQGTSNTSSAPRPPLFSRAKVSAFIEQADEKSRTLQVTMFNCLDSRLLPSATTAPEWRISRFLRSRSFTSLSRGRSPWVKEERQLGDTMKIRFMMRGDVLCSAVLRGDKEKVLDCVDEGYDVDARCRSYGSALQAAAAKGRLEIAEVLVEEGASVNTSGGIYKSPLIAAVVHGHDDIAKYLLRHKADVLVYGGQYVNALYQAVSFSDISMAHMLLEKGAWLSPNYLEILDLAMENGNRNMIRMLEDYDVRSLWKKRLPENDPRREPELPDNTSEASDGLTYVPYDERRAIEKPQSLSLVRAVLLEGLSLKGQRGKWTGIKAVKLLQTALRMGAPESIIDKATPFLSSFQSLLEVICKASKEYTEERQQKRELAGPSGDIRGPIEPSSSLSLPDQERPDIYHTDSGSSQDTVVYDAPERQRNGTDGAVDNDIFCLSCNDRGGKPGTERTCNDCNGSRSVWRRQGTHSRRLSCTTCVGRGYTFSRRDVCRACNNGAGTRVSTQPTTSAGPAYPLVRFEEVPDSPPPPPYSPR